MLYTSYTSAVSSRSKCMHWFAFVSIREVIKIIMIETKSEIIRWVHEASTTLTLSYTTILIRVVRFSVKTRAVLGFRGLYLECLVYVRMFVTYSVCVWLLLVMLRVCWFSVLVVGWCSKGCRVWLFGLDPTGTLMSAVILSIFSWLASRLFIVSDELCCWHIKDWK